MITHSSLPLGGGGGGGGGNFIHFSSWTVLRYIAAQQKIDMARGRVGGGGPVGGSSSARTGADPPLMTLRRILMLAGGAHRTPCIRGWSQACGRFRSDQS